MSLRRLKSCAAVMTALGVCGLSTSTAVPTFAAGSSSGSQAALSSIATPPPSLLAKSAILIDAANGQILYQKAADARRAPASTTKLMTMYLIEKAIQDHQASWDEYIPVTTDSYQVAVEQGVSSAYLDPKEHFTLRDMMRFIAVLSANDATVAVADKLGGDKAGFVAQMNQEAQQLGLTGTHYSNPDGLTAPDHYTTARDLSTLARDLVTHYPDLLQYTSLPKVTVRKGQTWSNTDEMIGKYPGVDGLKTGFTSDAGYCFVGTAKQGNRRLISVVMGDTTTNIEQRFVDTGKLFDYGFNDFTQVDAIPAKQPLAKTAFVANGRTQRLPVMVPTGLVVDLPTGVKGNTVFTAQLSLQAPVKANTQIGTVAYEIKGQIVASEPVVAAEDDPQANFVVRWMRDLGHWIGHLIHH